MKLRARAVLVICAAILGLAACASGNVSQAPDRPEPRYDYRH
jgi:hypothetical protein